MTVNLNTPKENQWFPLYPDDLGLMVEEEIWGSHDFEAIEEIASYEGRTITTSETNYLGVYDNFRVLERVSGWILAPKSFALREKKGTRLVIPPGTKVQCLEFEILEWRETFSLWEEDTSYTGKLWAKFQVLT